MKRLKFIALSLLLINVNSCSKGENELPLLREKSIFEHLATSMDYSYLTNALQKTNLDIVLSGEGNYTFYAPGNSAFIGFLIRQGYNSLDEVHTDELKQLLLNHVMVGKKSYRDFKSGYFQTVYFVFIKR